MCESQLYNCNFLTAAQIAILLHLETEAKPSWVFLSAEVQNKNYGNPMISEEGHHLLGTVHYDEFHVSPEISMFRTLS